MDAELREYLEVRFGQIDRRFEQMEQRFEQMEQRMSRVETEVRQLGVMVESVRGDVHLVAEGHSILYGSIDRHYEELRNDMRDVRSLLKVWNDLVTKRVGVLELRLHELARQVT